MLSMFAINFGTCGIIVIQMFNVSNMLCVIALIFIKEMKLRASLVSRAAKNRVDEHL